MHSIIEALNSPAFQLFGSPTSWAELLGFISGGVAVYLCVIANVWNFPIGMLNAAFFFILFTDAKLLADAWLQIGFLALNGMGLLVWLRYRDGRDERPIKKAPGWLLAAIALVGIAFAMTLVPILRENGGAYPRLDATTTALSVSAQILLSLKYVQNWYVWIVADLIYIPLYLVKGLTLTAIIYVVFLTLCVMGLRQWQAAMADPDGGLPVETPAPVPIGQVGSAGAGAVA